MHLVGLSRVLYVEISLPKDNTTFAIRTEVMVPKLTLDIQGFSQTSVSSYTNTRSKTQNATILNISGHYQVVPDEEMHPQKVDHDEARSCSLHDEIHVFLILGNADESS
jgi:hypothetical protein